MEDLNYMRRISKISRKTLRTTLPVGIAVITKVNKEERIRNSKGIEREDNKGFYG